MIIEIVMAGVLMVSAETDAPELNDLKPDLVDLEREISGLVCEASYHGSENFVGVQIDGYLAPKCLLDRHAAAKLKAVQTDLQSFGLTLIVYDGYRPQRAVDHFVRWAADIKDQRTKKDFYPHVDKSRLFAEGYIAEKSGHSRASTLDLTLGYRNADSSVTPLDMGTPFDFFDPKSHGMSGKIAAPARAKRLLLRSLMMQYGFRPYSAEWWHFTLDNEPYPTTYFNIPVK